MVYVTAVFSDGISSSVCLLGIFNLTLLNVCSLKKRRRDYMIQNRNWPGFDVRAMQCHPKILLEVEP